MILEKSNKFQATCICISRQNTYTYLLDVKILIHNSSTWCPLIFNINSLSFSTRLNNFVRYYIVHSFWIDNTLLTRIILVQCWSSVSSINLSRFVICHCFWFCVIGDNKFLWFLRVLDLLCTTLCNAVSVTIRSFLVLYP